MFNFVDVVVVKTNSIKILNFVRLSEFYMKETLLRIAWCLHLLSRLQSSFFEIYIDLNFFMNSNMYRTFFFLSALFIVSSIPRLALHWTFTWCRKSTSLTLFGFCLVSIKKYISVLWKWSILWISLAKKY